MLLALISGVLLALAAVPTALWPCAIAGLLVLYKAIDHRSWKRRAIRGFLCAAVLFTITLGWTRQFNGAGALALIAGEAVFVAVAAALVPSRRAAGDVWRAAAFVACMTLGELARVTVPLGGFQMGSYTTGMAGSPLAPTVSVLGEPGLVSVATLCAVAVAGLFRHRRMAICAAALAVVTVAIGSVDQTRPTGTWAVSTVQAGGPQALLRAEQDPDRVFAEHLRLARGVEGGVAMVWPENVVSVEGPVELAPEGALLSGLAREKNTFLGAGVVESAPADRFRNSFYVWGPDGRITSRYEKVLRVPFGEYVPARSFVERFADLSQVPSDAFIGRNPATVDFGTTKATVAVSYEGLFSRRVREGVHNGGDVVVVPTNAASYESRRVPQTQVQAARLRALETGRSVVQSAPTGISAVVAPDGRVMKQTAMGTASVLSSEVQLRDGQSLFVRWGYGPLTLLASAALIATWANLHGRRKPDRGLLGGARKANG